MISTGKVQQATCLIFLAGFVCFFTWSVEARAQDWQPVTDPVQIFQEGYIQVVSASEEKQSRYKALRAATVIAQRDLLEALQGLKVSGETTVKDGMLSSETVNSSVKGYLRGAVKCGEKYYSQLGYGEVCMRLNLRGKGAAYDVILPLMQKEGVVKPSTSRYSASGFVPQVMGGKDTVHPSLQAQTASQPQVAKPSELAAPSDGLILDLEGKGFKPALANRIMTEKEEVVFDPSTIVPMILAERGCGGFTNKIDKAKGLLSSWGSKEPMVIQAVSVNKGTDAVIDGDAAAAIYTHNQKTSFLSQAKVVFVIH
jgi:hypothetical protein